MKIMLICSTSGSVVFFRKKLIEKMKQNGFEIALIVGDRDFENEIASLNIKVYYIPFSNRDKSYIKQITANSRIKTAIKDFNPDIVFTFQIKANIFGVRMAKKAGVKNIYSMVEGLGDPFQDNSLKGKLLLSLICYLYKKSFSYVNKVFFLNSDDMKEFVDRKIVSAEKIVRINGIGIDPSKYTIKEKKDDNKRVSMLSRLLKNKGIIEYCEIASIVKKERNDIVFELYGSEMEIKKEDIDFYTKNGIVFYGGYANNPQEVINNSSLIAICSHREGFPVCALEAMMLKKAIVAFDAPGTREAVINEKTGYLIPIGDTALFAKKIIELIDDEKRMSEYGEEGREYVLSNCTSDIVNDKILNVIQHSLIKTDSN